MPRVASVTAQGNLCADALHEHDVIVKGHREWRVLSARKQGAHVILTVCDESYEQSCYRVERSYLVAVRMEHECDCSGTGIFRGGGHVENGVYKGFSGPHFACNGKGWQNRSDVIRNVVYWDKYARIAC